MLRVDYGDTCVNIDGQDYIFRPSFFNASKLGTGKEIVKTFSDLHSLGADFNKINNLPERWIPEYLKTYSRSALPAACAIMSCCAELEYDNNVFGYFYERGGKLLYKQGSIPVDNIIVIAKHLLKHMIVGNPKESNSKKEYSDSFDVSEVVDMAMIHLGISEGEALKLSMSRFQAMMATKFPEVKSDHPTDKEYEECMDWHAKVKAKREAMH